MVYDVIWVNVLNTTLEHRKIYKDAKSCQLLGIISESGANNDPKKLRAKKRMNEPSSVKTTTNNFEHCTDFRKKICFLFEN